MSSILNSFIEKRWLEALERLKAGSLTFIAPDGTVTVAKGPEAGPDARFAIKDWDVIRRIVQRGDIALGEDYVDGAWETDDIEALIAFFLLNMDAFENYANGGFFSRMALVISDRFLRRNSVSGSRRNIEAHYDVGNDFYALWLDRSMTYSSAIFGGASGLEQAQVNKYDRILSKLARGGESILEIGCGWGGFAERAAQRGQKVTGLTISPSQHRFATERLKGAADILLEDYRKVKGVFDNIVSIEMFEAVGEQYWPRYFQALAERLKRGGRAVVQTITIQDELFRDYRLRSDFIRHYVFPGGMLPSLQRFREEAERAGLKVVDHFAFGRDYAETLREWSRRMYAQAPEIKAMGHDDRFLRNWQYYLNICAAAFEVGRTDVVQVELVHA
ncbi:cyclopropane-fatty-acyl-phospholipid synthase [Rhizomicrobium palustre]|uniref:Cyclopropane-fatty-acyl-phospholipid synthase n=1 Tax=Rhizomicrobium palustre TaxID=189966 RepID=A0A846MXT2_9PROT|nr:cyclopropane-fatty-acyl-phospholipid synthase family protein [Rhizomicrobium palustre]NIK88035.1 cyclopropane-fatty-acyl-phospholipid synthase [Rhizomicrobium palustre]